MVGSDAQHFNVGENTLTTETQLTAGTYIFITNGVHETKSMQCVIDDIVFLAGKGAMRQYYGGACPGMSMVSVMTVEDNPIIGLRITSSTEYTTFSQWVIQPVRIK